jgi:hypothetical protein
MMDEVTKLRNSILSLTEEMEAAKQELESAQKQRIYAQQVEAQWASEVESLTTLIELRRKRLGISAPDPTQESDGQQRLELMEMDESRIAIETPPEGRTDDSGTTEVNRVNWIQSLVEQSGIRGISPQEILAQAATVNLSMHPNYPYVVLLKLMRQDRIAKRGGRYFKR